MPICPHGDPYCPCQDGDACHYEPTATTPAWNGTYDDTIILDEMIRTFRMRVLHYNAAGQHDDTHDYLWTPLGQAVAHTPLNSSSTSSTIRDRRPWLGGAKINCHADNP